MSPLLISLSAAAGAAGGALVPLTAYRLSVPADEPSRTACTSCDAPLRRGVGGWVRLHARCSACGARLGPPAWLTAAAAATASGLLAAALDATLALPLYVALAILGVLLAVIDLSCKRLPRTLVFPAVWISASLFAVIAAVTGDWGALLRAALAAVVLGSAFLVLYLLPGRGLGFGDVKLAVLLGLFLGWLSWGAVLLGALLPWLVNGPVAIGLLLTRRVGRKSWLPFGPAMLVGALLSVLCVGWLRTFARG